MLLSWRGKDGRRRAEGPGRDLGNDGGRLEWEQRREEEMVTDQLRTQRMWCVGAKAARVSGKKGEAHFHYCGRAEDHEDWGEDLPFITLLSFWFRWA